jgi:hypothetical protein
MSTVEHRSHKGLDQSGREFASVIAKTKADDAGLSFPGRFATFRLDLLGAPKSFRLAAFQTIRIRYPPSPSQSHGGMERRDRSACPKFPRSFSADVFQTK